MDFTTIPTGAESTKEELDAMAKQDAEERTELNNAKSKMREAIVELSKEAADSLQEVFCGALHCRGSRKAFMSCLESQDGDGLTVGVKSRGRVPEDLSAIP